MSSGKYSGEDVNIENCGKALSYGIGMHTKNKVSSNGRRIITARYCQVCTKEIFDGRPVIIRNLTHSITGRHIERYFHIGCYINHKEFFEESGGFLKLQGWENIAPDLQVKCLDAYEESLFTAQAP